jgi:hypothetical protein
MSVYKIVDRTSAELIYIGQTSDFEIRKEWHYCDYEIKKESDLYRYIRNNGGWDNMEFSILATEINCKMRLRIENTLQIELHPMFYWICNRKDIPNKIVSDEIPTRKRSKRRKKGYLYVPGKVLDLPEVG